MAQEKQDTRLCADAGCTNTNDGLYRRVTFTDGGEPVYFPFCLKHALARHFRDEDNDNA